MGIPGLLEHLKSVINRSHISEFSGKSVAVDAHCWLHRGAFACSKDLVQGNPTEKYITFFISMINMLKKNGITSILIVFDGLPLPNKSETNLKRSNDRKKNMGLAREAEANGDQKLAMTYYQRSVSVTFDMIKKLLTVLEKEGVSYMISPYESDAQLAFLSRNNTVDFIITEDSDTIPYGCSSVMFKMDKEGYGELFEQSKLHTNHILSFVNWSEDQFKLFCCLAGCDYMPGLRNFGIKTAYKVVHKYKTLSKVLEHLSFSNAAVGYEGDLATRLEQALLTYKHQTIFNPFAGCTEPLTPLPLALAYLNTTHSNQHNTSQITCSTLHAGVRSTTSRSALTNNTSHTEFAFLGPLLDPTVALQLARGKIDPKSITTLDDPTLNTSSCTSVNNPTPVFADTIAESNRPLTPDRIHFTGFGDHDDAATSEVCYSTPLQQQQGQSSMGIKWFSSEDRALHTAHAQRLHSSISIHNNHTIDNHNAARSSGTTVPVGHSLKYRNNTTTATQPSVGRKRGRPTGSVQQTIANPSHPPHNTITSISMAGAMSATSSYQSDLISDNLAPLHRRTRLRSTEPIYSTTYTTINTTSADDSHMMHTLPDNSDYYGDSNVDYVDYDIWDTTGDQSDSWDQHASFPVVHNTTIKPTRKGSTFFQDADTTDYTTDNTNDYAIHLYSPTLNTNEYTSGEYESSCVDDDYMCTTEDYNGPTTSDPLYNNIAGFPTTDGSDLNNTNSREDQPSSGLKQFQDTDFDSRFAHQYTLHPVGVSRANTVLFGTPKDNLLSNHVAGTCTSLSQCIPSVYSAPDSSFLPTHSTIYPFLPTSLSTSRSYRPYTNNNNTTDYTSHYSINTNSNYLSPSYADTNSNSYSAQFLHDARVQEESWKHQQFPGLLHS